MPSWRVALVVVLLVVAAFGIAFGVARLLRGGSSSPASRPEVIEVAGSQITVFGPPARLPALRRP